MRYGPPMQHPDQHAASPQPSVCLDCDAALTGRWCSNCGQSEEARHRSLRHLVAEFAEVMTHADSRLWRTLGRLAWKPGRLTRAYLEGHRISQLPPLRLVLIALFLLFTVASVLAPPMHLPRVPAGNLAEMQHEIVGSDPDLREVKKAVEGSARSRDAERWLRARISHAVAEPGELVRFIADWAERFAILMLPASALMLAVLFLGHGFTLFDHLVFSMHSITASAIVVLAVMLGDRAGIGAVNLLLLLPPLHLFRHMRGVYGTGTAGTLWRMALLGLGSFVIFTLLVVSLVALAVTIGG